MKIVLHKSTVNRRPFFLVLDQYEKVIEILTNYSLYLNSFLRFSPNSLLSYVQDIKNFLEFSSVGTNSSFQIDLLIKSVRSVSVSNFLESLEQRDLSENTLRSCDRRLKFFFEWLYSFKSNEGLNEKESPYNSDKLFSPTPHKGSKKFVTYLEVASFLKSFKSEHDRVVGHFMYDVGVRVSELERVLVSDLPDPNNYPDYFTYYPITIRGSKGRGGIIKEHESLISRIVLNRVWRYYNNWVKPNLSHKKTGKKKVLVFHNSRLGPIKKRTITDTYRRHSLILLAKGLIRLSINPHRFRHGAAFSIMSSNFGNDMLENLVIVKKMLGHASLKSSEVYANIPIDVLMRIKEMNSDSLVLTRYQEAELIYNETFIRLSN